MTTNDANTSQAIDTIREKVRAGEMTIEQFHVERVRIQRVYLVTSRIPADARGHLNAAVKRGELGHVKKDGRKPEAYFHPTFDYLVASERNAHERSIVSALAAVCAA